MLVILLCPPPSQDFASLWSDYGAEVTCLTDSLLNPPIVLCVCTRVCALCEPAHTLMFLLVDFPLCDREMWLPLASDLLGS